MATIRKGTSITKDKTVKGEIPVIAGGQEAAYYHNVSNRDGNVITISASGAYSGFANYHATPIFASDCNTVESKDESKISTLVIFQFLKSVQSELYNLQRGQAQPHVYGEDIAKIRIPVLSTEIQQSIVDEINAIDNSANESSIDIIKTKESIISLVNSITANKVRLGDIADKIGSGATPRGGSGVYKTEGITFIRSQNIYDNEFVKDGLTYIDDKQAKALDGVTVKNDDVLFNITGASVARCCIVDNTLLPARVNQHVAIIRPKADVVLSKYLMYMLIIGKDDLLTIAKGATSREAITKLQLEEFAIPLATIDEQKKIIAKIEKLEAEIAKAQNVIDAAPEQKQAILKRYL